MVRRSAWFFFFKQKTAYEMRISDWSSDVCSSDLIIALARQYGRYGYRRVTALLRDAGWHVNRKRVERIWRREGLKVPQRQPKRGRLWLRSEEHTSELQSLMRISYAVFCLKKKTKI